MPKIILALILLLAAGPALAEECEYVCEYVCAEAETAAPEYDYSQQVILSEIYPAPLDGQDEFIELQNTGEKKVSLEGWYLTDASGKKYQLSGQLDKFLTVYQADSKIYLNNSGDEVNLYQPNDILLDSVLYDDGGEAGWSYARAEDWFWTTTPTPNQKNEITQADGNTDEVIKDDDADAEESENENEEIENIEVQSILEVRGLEKGSEVIVEGVVTVVPDTLSSQIFYLEDATGGIQIYSSQKTFPDLNLGDLVQVSGELSEAYDEKKINIQSEEQIKILGQQEITIGEVQSLGEELEGQLVSTTAQIAQKDGSKLYLTNNIIIYKKSAVDISFTDLKEGDDITVIGLVSQYQNEYRLLPRSAEDLVVNQKYQDQSSASTTIIKAAQAAEIDGLAWSLPVEPQEKKVLYILIVIIGGLLIALGVVIYQRVRNTDNMIKDDGTDV